MTLRIDLDSVIKYRNGQEYRSISRARCGDKERCGDGFIIKQLCSDLLADHDPNTLVDVYRGQTRCFSQEKLSVWAAGKFGRGEQPKHLRKKI